MLPSDFWLHIFELLPGKNVFALLVVDKVTADVYTQYKKDHGWTITSKHVKVNADPIVPTSKLYYNGKYLNPSIRYILCEVVNNNHHITSLYRSHSKIAAVIYASCLVKEGERVCIFTKNEKSIKEIMKDYNISENIRIPCDQMLYLDCQSMRLYEGIQIQAQQLSHMSLHTYRVREKGERIPLWFSLHHFKQEELSIFLSNYTDKTLIVTANKIGKGLGRDFVHNIYKEYLYLKNYDSYIFINTSSREMYRIISLCWISSSVKRIVRIQLDESALPLIPVPTHMLISPEREYGISSNLSTRIRLKPVSKTSRLTYKELTLLCPL